MSEKELNLSSYMVEIEDIEYLRSPGKSLMATVYRPKAAGPFAAVIDIHGGAWTANDRFRDKAMATALARAGLVVVSIDFSQGIEGAYPQAVCEVNYAVRWVKANARKLGVDPDRVGLSGQSSGGHLAMLVAMKPYDPILTAIPLPVGSPNLDATVRCVEMTWPVINPLGRYRYARNQVATSPEGDAWSFLLKKHENFWGRGDVAQAEINMGKGSPLVILQKGEKVSTPPAVWIQVPDDDHHVYVDPESDTSATDMAKFVAAYRNVGGKIDVEFFEAPTIFTVKHPESEAAVKAFSMIAGFFHQHLSPRS